MPKRRRTNRGRSLHSNRSATKVRVDPEKMDSLFSLPAFQAVTETQRDFLELLAQGKNQTEAGEALGCSRSCHYYWLKTSDAYRTAFEQIKAIAVAYVFDTSALLATKSVDFLSRLIDGKVITEGKTEKIPAYLRAQVAIKMIDNFQKFALAQETMKAIEENKKILEEIRDSTKK